MKFFRRLFSKEDNRENNTADTTISLQEGDIFYIKDKDQYHLYKLLVHDVPLQCYHVLLYYPLDHKPTTTDIASLQVKVYHAPIDDKGFPDIQILAHSHISAEDLEGYHEYLRQTSPPEEWMLTAQEYYFTGIQLSDAHKYPEAIDSYSKAIDLAPGFFEAIDNRAFCKMDMGRWSEAIEDFRLSLAANPDSMMAEFSIGQCYLKTGDLINAGRQFEIAHQLAPGDPAPLEFLRLIDELEKGK